MRLIISNGIYFLLLAGFGNMQLSAQSILNKLEFGLHSGSFIYQGDLTPSKLGSFKTPGWLVGLSTSTPLNHFLSLRGNFSVGIHSKQAFLHFICRHRLFAAEYKA